MKRLASLLALVVSACASNQAPITYGGAAGPARATTPPRTAQAPRSQPLQRPSQLDRSQQAPDWAAAPGPNLSDYALQPDAAQPFDPAQLPRTHRVAPNESLYDISDRYQIPLRALIDQNRLEPPFAVAPGRVLDLPPPRFHRMQRGESFEDVARQYNVDLRSLALLNRMRPPYAVREGDQIVLPAMARARAQTAAAETPAPAPRRAATPAVTPPAPSAPSVAPPAGPAPTLAWPLRGDIVARFGAQPSGGRVDGVEIAAAEGASFGAAAEGEVVYAGTDLGSYGTLVLVRHSDGYVTAYGYARRALVREGQRVRAGQALGEVGRVGSAPPRLLFQVRRGRDAIDPLPLLGGG